MAMIIDRSLRPLNSSKTMASSRRRDDNSRERVQNVREEAPLDAEVKDTRGLPVARLTYAWGDNDVALAAAARDMATRMMAASGAQTVRVGLNYGAHAMGSRRICRVFRWSAYP
jgi:hypothetical protein